MTDKAYSLNSLLNEYIKPEYHACFQLLIPSVDTFTNYAYNNGEIMLLYHMYQKYPHAIEYVNWQVMYNSNPMLVQHELDGSQQFANHLKEHYNELYEQIIYNLANEPFWHIGA